MKLSVVIVNYNVQYFLEQVLHSVRKAVKVMQAEANWQTEVFVVDNNSVDGSCQMVEQKFPEVRLIANRKNTGFSAANNQAIKQSTGEYVLLLNPDTVVEEDTFLQTVRFMDEHPDAGGLGVKMLDGGGKFLPESKRGFPSPKVAFYKIFGLSALFPKSKEFGKYHLGYLDKDETHEVDVLAGAFMLLRKKTLQEIGLLDEDFFMYGEDIDLSYRIKLAGYKNYYYPHTRIIHYKGESTKKSSVNYVFIFYNAMIIFAQKHFSKQKAQTFSLLIKTAIYLRAGASVAIRFAKQMVLPAIDFAVLIAGMFFIKRYWELNHKYVLGGSYPEEFMYYSVPAYILMWMLGIALAGCYHFPVSFRQIIRGVGGGTVAIAVIYAFLPEELRYSRAIIGLGAIWAFFAILLIRLVWHYLREGNYHLGEESQIKILIVGKPDEAERVLTMVEKSKRPFSLVGFAGVEKSSQTGHHHIGHINQLHEIIEIYKVDEVIFCARDIASRQIISLMSDTRHRNVHYKIAPEDSFFVIGSNDKNAQGDLYTIEIQMALAMPRNRFNKRFQDFGLAMAMLVLYPLLVWFVREKGNFFVNIFLVLFGYKTWVGYFPLPDLRNLPQLKQGVLNPRDRLGSKKLELGMLERLNFLYARDYTTWTDLEIILRGLKYLGRTKFKTAEYEKANYSYKQSPGTNRAVQPGH